MIELPLLVGALLMLIVWPDSRSQQLRPAYEMDCQLSEDHGRESK